MASAVDGSIRHLLKQVSMDVRDKAQQAVKSRSIILASDQKLFQGSEPLPFDDHVMLIYSPGEKPDPIMQ